MVKYNRGIVRAHYDAALERLADGRWTCDPETGTIWSKRTGQPIKPTVRNNYAQISLRYGGCNRTVTLSRVIWEYVHGPIPDGLEINHKNGVKLDDCIGNYELVTCSGNKVHAIKTGLVVLPKGSECPWATLNDTQVIEIRDLCRQRVPQYEVARRYGITQGTVSLISTGRRWGHLPGSNPAGRCNRLAPDQVVAIRAALAAGESQRSIAIRYGIAQGTVSNIKCGRR